MKQTDYDFIEINPIIKKPTKVTKLKQVAVEKPTTKTRKPRKSKNHIEKEQSTKSLNACLQEEEKAPPPAREGLSPVSQMILERERRQTQAKPVEQAEMNIDDALGALPVARRTRAGRRSLNPPPQDVVQEAPPAKLPSPPKQRTARGRKQATTAASKVGKNAKISDMLPAGSRGNRRQVAEIAARSHVVDTIDMVSAVMPPIEGFVNLDSDDENATPAQLDETATKQASKFDEDNPEIDVNLSWQGEIQMYKLRQYQKFAHMFKEISKRNNVPVEHVVVNMGENILKSHQTPLDVGLKVFHILNGCAIAAGTNPVKQQGEVDLYTKPKKFQLKVQGDRWKRPLIIHLNKSDSFKILYIKCAEEMECSVEDFSLFFDGELLEPDDTPKNQEMEGNEMIDFRNK
ncbi:hypothetical protein KR093_007442 [Drosophila rubida]|uniref:Rad60/SUMO-like domain-containing protein n=1 Tax=Drosophila rubida TaxID=30044 RepID=A0AAD4K747_9MUSC|nr:hypothetical protein KR093_007442 [Drosophila rubida]